MPLLFYSKKVNGRKRWFKINLTTNKTSHRNMDCTENKKRITALSYINLMKYIAFFSSGAAKAGRPSLKTTEFAFQIFKKPAIFPSYKFH
ncbi:hypothetical protein CBW18_11245 [Pedobacter sp. AJM]|nr:hypothetical protein CBW18_11245 [Pedobacter sp. AJM]